MKQHFSQIPTPCTKLSTFHTSNLLGELWVPTFFCFAWVIQFNNISCALCTSQVGKALFDGQLLDVHFTRSFYKHILGAKVTYHDIEAIDPDYYKNLKWLLEVASSVFLAIADMLLKYLFCSRFLLCTEWHKWHFRPYIQHWCWWRKVDTLWTQWGMSSLARSEISTFLFQKFWLKFV